MLDLFKKYLSVYGRKKSYNSYLKTNPVTVSSLISRNCVTVFLSSEVF